jgi:MFS transporter, DHA1 family, multidrug resistance protein
MSRFQYVLFVVLIAGISSLNPVAVDAFLPAMPAIAKAMAVDPGTLGVTLGIFTLGTALGQITFGPVSDRFGRKPIIIFGLCLYFLMALLAPYSPNIESLSFVRFIQGIGAASGRIIGVAIVRDLYAREKAARLLSNIWTVSTMMPILNPFIGSALIYYFHWSSIFVYMAGFAAIMTVLTIFFFKETLAQKNLHALRPRQLFANFTQISMDRTFVAYTICASFSASSLYGFLAASSDLLITQLKQSPTTFAWQFAVVMCGSMAGSFISGRLSVRLGTKRMLGIGVTITALASSLFLALSLNGVFTAFALIAPFVVQRMGEAMISAQSMAGAMTPFPDRAGAASSLLGFWRQIAGATAAILVSYYADGTSLPMAIAFFAAGIVPAIIFFLYIRKIS